MIKPVPLTTTQKSVVGLKKQQVKKKQRQNEMREIRCT